MKTNLSIRNITIEFFDCDKSTVLKAIEDMIAIAKLTAPGCHNVCAILKGVYVSVNSQSDIAEVYKKWNAARREMKPDTKTDNSLEQARRRGC